MSSSSRNRGQGQLRGGSFGRGRGADVPRAEQVLRLHDVAEGRRGRPAGPPPLRVPDPDLGVPLRAAPRAPPPGQGGLRAVRLHRQQPAGR